MSKHKDGTRLESLKKRAKQLQRSTDGFLEQIETKALSERQFQAIHDEWLEEQQELYRINTEIRRLSQRQVSPPRPVAAGGDLKKWVSDLRRSIDKSQEQIETLERQFQALHDKVVEDSVKLREIEDEIRQRSREHRISSAAGQRRDEDERRNKRRRNDY